MLLFLLACQPEKETENLQEDTASEFEDTAIGDTGEPAEETDTEETDTQDTEETDTNDTEDTDTEDTGDTQEDPACPDGVICPSSFPYSHSSTTSTSTTSDFDSYSCAPSTNESGPENIYRVILAEEGFLALDLATVGSGADVDVHLLEQLNPNTCIDRGHWTAGGLLPAGEYWVIVDSWVNSSGDIKDGSYTLEIGHTTISDLVNFGLQNDIAEDALYAFDSAWLYGDTSRFEYMITDFHQHSSLKRSWVIDLSTEDLLFDLHIAHGEASSNGFNSGYADSFSNINNSHQSSLGMMKGAEQYVGSFGYSMRIDGLESGYNDLVRSRAIVLHPWEGSRQEYVNQFGEVAPTWGCPAVDDRLTQDVVDALKDGSLLFFWYPDGDWSENSTYLPQ